MIRPVFELIQGIIIGAGAILPGISGASLAVVFGFYEEFMDLIAHPVKNIKTFFRRRAFLCIGIAFGFLSLTLLLDQMFSTHTTPLVFLFSGFIAGTLPEIFTVARKHGIGKGEVIAFFLTAGLLIILAFTRDATAAHSAPGGLAAPFDSLPKTGIPIWFFAGAIIALGSLLPGLSASFILIFLGLYGPLLDAVRHIDLPVAVSLGAGALISLIVFSRIIDALYHRFHGIMSFTVLGFTLGSLFLVFPGIHRGTGIPLYIALSLAGFASSYLLARYGKSDKAGKKSL